MTAVEFLDKLEQQGLLDAKLVSKLRQQVSGARKTVSARKIAKLLIDKGHLTAFQAKKLMDDEARPQPKTGLASKNPAPAPEPAVNEGVDGLELLDEGENDLGLELVESDPLAGASGLTPIDDDGLRLVEDDPLADVPEVSSSGAVARKPVKGPVGDAGLKPVEDGGGLTLLDSALGMTSASSGVSGESVFPDDDLSLDPINPLAGGAGMDLASSPDAAPPAKAAPKKLTKLPKVKGQSQWDTPLMVVGGGSLILLVVLAFALYRFIFATNATEVFEAATDAYRAQSYTQAISSYEDFLKSFPTDPNAGTAWVRIRMARLRQVVEGKSWDRALETAKEVLKEIEQAIASESPPVKELPAAFNEHGRPELASLLPDIAAGFASQARGAKTMADAERLVALAEDAMTLVNNAAYIPTSLRESVATRIDAIREDIAIARRNINRDKALVQALTEIDQALGKSDTPAAFEVRKALLKNYPDLEGHPFLIEAVRRITEKERELVALLEEPRQPLTDEKPGEGGVKVVTAAVNGEAAPGVTGSTVVFLVRGAVYGFDATTGQVRWRRFVGHETMVHPQRASRETAADVLYVDGQNRELVRVAGDTGELQWRLPLETTAAAPVAAGDRMFVSTESGALLEVDAANGASGRQVKFPQPLRSPPAVDEARGLLFQAGEHSNLYVLSSETLDCKLVYYLNHRAGTVTTPPVLSRGQMFIAENAGADYCLIHVLPATDALDKLKPSQAPFRLRGNVVAPPFVYERRVVVVTDLGGIYLFEIDSANQKQPVSIVAESLPTLREATFGYAVADAGQLWVADARLVRYEVQAARGELVRRSIRDDAGVYAAPLQLVGNVLFHARRQANSEGVVVTAANASTLRPYWSTEVGTPMVGLITEPPSALAVMSAQGSLFPLSRETIQQGVNAQSQRPAALEPEAVFEPPLTLPDGRLAFPGAERKNRILVFDPEESGAPQVVELKTPEGRATASPVVFQDGLLVPSSAGLVYLADSKTGENLALPLRPPMSPGDEVIWQSPAVTADGKEFIIANDHKKAYRVVLRQQPKPHLAALTTRDLDGVIVSRLARAGDTVYGVERSSQGDALLAFELPALAFRKVPLDGRLAWGPHELDGVVLVATHRSLLRLDGGAEPRWMRPLEHGVPVAPPWIVEGHYLFASVGGTVWRLGAETGQESGRTPIGEPLAAGPAVVGSQLLVGGSDGVLHIVPWKN